MDLELNEFIWQLYILALGRTPDPVGLENYKYLICSGAPKEAVIYMVCTSNEFANRAQIVNLDRYRKAYWLYRLRFTPRRLPIIGWIWAVVAIPRRLFRLEVEERVRYLDRLYQERQRLEVLLEQYNSLSAKFDIFRSDNELRIGDLINQVSELSANYENLDTRGEILHTEISALSAMANFNTNQITSILHLANKNITHANEKLDEMGSLILKTANQNRPVIYGLAGGVTIIRINDYIFGVPSEEWRLVVFLSTYGRFEFGTEDYFRSIIKDGMNVLDIGANLGIYTLHALKAGCNVYSYEPTPRVFNILVDNVGINGFEPTGRAHIYDLAVSDKEGEVDLAVYNTRNGHNSIFPRDANDEIIKVRTVSLDAHLKDLDHIDVVKIDVEGAEPLVIRGMREIITKNPGMKIIMEFAPEHLKRGGCDPMRFINEIYSLDLDIRLIDEQSGEVREISDEELSEVFSANVLLTKTSRSSTGIGG